jgi:hypothetical protein
VDRPSDCDEDQGGFGLGYNRIEDKGDGIDRSNKANQIEFREMKIWGWWLGEVKKRVCFAKMG